MPKIKIDGQEIEVDEGTSLFQAAEIMGVEIPHFCYHEKLSVAGNCRMCMVEIEGRGKLVPSCVTPAGEGMSVLTNSKKVRNARKSVMETMLINHPLDCPLCDQGGECDLQDQAFAYGRDRSRFDEDKRTVPDKYISPLIKTVMNRCINCTRCVRFCEEVAGVYFLGQMHRGENAEIGTFIEQAAFSELSGNMIDICPVGALTSRPAQFSARPWELKKTYSIDVHDAVGSNIRIDSKADEVIRILPRSNKKINDEWINDRTRFACDGLKSNRLDTPMIRKSVGAAQTACSWEEAFLLVSDRMKTLKPDNIAAFAGDLCDVESMLALKDFMEILGSKNIECRVDGARFDPSNSVGYLFNTSIAGIEQADAILLVATNPRWEATTINTRIINAFNNRRIPIGVIGESIEFGYPYSYLGSSPHDLEDLMQGTGDFSSILRQAKRPMMIVGQGAFCRDDALAVHALTKEVAEFFGMITDEWNGYNILHTAASRVGALEIGFYSESEIDLDNVGMVYLLGVDNPNIIDRIHPLSLVVYQGHHGGLGAKRADVILPGCAYTEKDGIYMNTEGRPQMAKKAVEPPGQAKEDWKIIRALSEYARQTLRYDDIEQLRQRLVNEFPKFGLLNRLSVASWCDFGKKGHVYSDDFVSRVDNFYLSNIIARNSMTMRACSREFFGYPDEKTDEKQQEESKESKVKRSQ